MIQLHPYIGVVKTKNHSGFLLTESSTFSRSIQFCPLDWCEKYALIGDWSNIWIVDDYPVFDAFQETSDGLFDIGVFAPIRFDMSYWKYLYFYILISREILLKKGLISFFLTIFIFGEKLVCFYLKQWKRYKLTYKE